MTYHTKNKEKLNLNDKIQSIDANTTMKWMLKLSDKDFKAGIIKTFQQAIMNTHERNERNQKSQQNNSR